LWTGSDAVGTAEPSILPSEPAAPIPLRLVETAEALARAEDAELRPEVALVDPGLALRGRVTLHADLAEHDSVAWVEYHAAPSCSRDWQVLARSSAAPFSAVVDTTALCDGDYDLRIFVARRNGVIDGSRALRGRAVANGPLTVSVRQPQPGATVGGAVSLEARASPACAQVSSLCFELSSDGQRWWPMLRALRTGPSTAVWYTAGLREGAYLLRAVASFATGARATSEAAEVHLAVR
jgi:hypothetical protein